MMRNLVNEARVAVYCGLGVTFTPWPVAPPPPVLGCQADLGALPARHVLVCCRLPAATGNHRERDTTLIPL